VGILSVFEVPLNFEESKHHPQAVMTELGVPIMKYRLSEFKLLE